MLAASSGAISLGAEGGSALCDQAPEEEVSCWTLRDLDLDLDLEGKTRLLLLFTVVALSEVLEIFGGWLASQKFRSGWSIERGEMFSGVELSIFWRSEEDGEGGGGLEKKEMIAKREILKSIMMLMILGIRDAAAEWTHLKENASRCGDKNMDSRWDPMERMKKMGNWSWEVWENEVVTPLCMAG